MVLINKLTIKGFKSFANKTELVFGKGFNCIIGPNGAGKTNVSDSICFVLGKSSAHEMRAEKSANLIFNGGKKGSPAKEAEVTIEFDNASRKFPIDKDIVEITRIVKLNGTSVYKINDEIRTRQQVLDVLRITKIDPDGHNIVLQGDIVSMAEMKPVERRGIIEQIAGISMYEEKKQKCLNELQKVDSRLNEAEIILTEREANLRELKKERDQAVKYKELEETLRDKKGTLIHLQIKVKQESLEEIEKRKKEVEEKITKISEEINSIKQEIQKNKDEISQINTEVEVKGEKNQVILRKEVEELKTIIVKANSRLEVLQNELVKIKERQQTLKNSSKEIEDKIKELEKSKQEKQKSIELNQKEESEVLKELEQFKEKHGIDTNLNQSLENIDKEIDETLLKINKVTEEKQNLLRNKDQITYKINSIQERLNALKGNDKEIEDLKNKKKRLEELNKQLGKVINEDSSYSLQLNTLRNDINKNTEELAKQKSRQISIQERTLGDLAIRKILELKNEIPGIHGTISSLGAVDAKYSLSLEVAAGPRSSSIVVDSDLIAKRCIEHLKNNKFGTATFLPLNKIKTREIDNSLRDLLKKPGIHGLAIDLVKYDQEYKDVFFYTFGSTIIVEDIETARKIGIGRARMVTIEGDLMETSGAMIGGYRTKRQGFGFKEKETDSNVSKLEADIEHQRRLINNIEEKKISNEEIIKKLRDEKVNLESDVIKIEKTLNIQDVSSIIEEKKKLEEEEKEFDKKLKVLEADRINFSKDLDDVKYKRNKLKEKIADPNLTKLLEKIEEKRLKVKERLLEIKGSINNISTQIESMLLPEREKIDKIIKQQDKEYEDFSKEVDSIKEILKARNKELNEKEDEEKKIYTKFKDLINKRNKLSEKIQSLEIDTAKEDEKLKGNEQKVNNINIDRAKIVAELEGLNKEFEPYQEATMKRGISIDDLKLQIKEDEKEISKIGNVNLRALEVYEQIQQEYEKVIQKVTQLKVEKDDVLNMMQEIESKKKSIFMKTYKTIAKKFQEIFGELTTKGEVQIILENEENPFEGGIDIQVKVQGSKYLDIKSLSGGEKTMAALAFLFAIQEHDPSPFYLLDEVDAALDKRNSELLSKLIAKYTDKAQYVVISHNDNIITEADSIYGVSMQNNISKVVSLKV
ncbi:MAG TPA: chromosome segregation protein SMC [Candidatus Nanoarchaeia archaeon]|nr:chromosome segregation protein SMC [Candidatus Nanoarchaeia archaeon]